MEAVRWIARGRLGGVERAEEAEEARDGSAREDRASNRRRTDEPHRGELETSVEHHRDVRIIAVPYDSGHLVHLQDRFWAMSCSAAYESAERTTRSLVNAHKASLSITQKVS